MNILNYISVWENRNGEKANYDLNKKSKGVSQIDTLTVGHISRTHIEYLN